MYMWGDLTMSTKIKLTREEFSEISSDRAEKIHHQTCSFVCCGEHYEGFIDDDTKCPECGMTSEEQQSHNEHVWEIIDNVEHEMYDDYEVTE